MTAADTDRASYLLGALALTFASTEGIYDAFAAWAEKESLRAGDTDMALWLAGMDRQYLPVVAAKLLNMGEWDDDDEK